ncbi:MAG TPA: TonB-dependent receptor [Phnomibacter sp.]|nr:TonB-dependent receptor [Phnomibacter sp.]
MRKLALLVMCLIGLVGAIIAQNRTITGKVTDSKGAPVEGASVVVKGTSTGVVTGADGSYSISVPASAKILVISSISFKSEEVNIATRTTANVALTSADSQLDEVVVVGYQQVQKKAVTGAVAQVAGEELANRPVLSVDQALTGKAAGVLVNTSSGLVGDNVIIRVRGASSISSGSQPLIILDGIPLDQGNSGQLYNPSNPLADLNPNDIESVEVLKDAASAAIYGSRGAAGVIIITTKKGKAGTAKINYDMFVGFNEPSRNMEVFDAERYTTVINTMRRNANLGDVARYGDINGDGQLDVVSTNWQKEVYRKGLTQQHQISAQGGGNRATYFASINYSDFENYIINNRQRRVVARINSTAKAADWLTFGLNAQYGRTLQNGLGSGTGGAASGIPLGPLLYFPNVPVRGANGDYYLGQGGNTFGMGVIPNPVAVLKANFDNRDTRRFLGSVFGEAQIIKGLKLKSQFNADYGTAFSDQFWNPTVGDGSGLAGVAQNVYDETSIWSWFNTLNYNTKIAGDHTLDVLLGSEFVRRKGFWNYGFGIGLNDPAFTFLSPNNYSLTGAELGGFDANSNGLASYFGALNYGFRNKYLASFNFRADAYSGFGRDNRFGYFPSASLAWRFTEESFLRNSRILTDGKLRASYGVTGNSNIGSFPAIAAFAPTLYADIPALNLNNPGNSSLRWERSIQLDIGVDFTLWNRLDVVMDYYEKKTDALILANPVLATLGFPGNTITQNIGQLKSTGFEFALNSRNIVSKNVNWTTNFNIAWNKNMVLSTNDNKDDIFGGNGIARPGERLGAYYLIPWAGVNPATGWATWFNAAGQQVQFNPTASGAAQWTNVADGRNVPAITAGNDRVVQSDKTPYPKWFGGMVNSVNFWNFDFSLDLQYAFGFWLYNNTLQNLMTYTNQRNKSVKLLDAWTTPGQVTDVPRLYWNDVQQSQTSTRWLEKGDFVRIRNVQLGYNFPKAMIAKAKMQSLRIYAQVQNAYTFTNYSGIDPEANANGNANIGLGIDGLRPYLPRTYAAGLQVGL